MTALASASVSTASLASSNICDVVGHIICSTLLAFFGEKIAHAVNDIGASSVAIFNSTVEMKPWAQAVTWAIVCYVINLSGWLGIFASGMPSWAAAIWSLAVIALFVFGYSNRH